MDAVKAKRRYKVLVREQTRLREKGQTDTDLETEVGKLLQDFPELGGGSAPKPLSEETTSMLRFAEQMSDQGGNSAAGEGAGAATAPTISAKGADAQQQQQQQQQQPLEPEPIPPEDEKDLPQPASQLRHRRAAPEETSATPAAAAGTKGATTKAGDTQQQQQGTTAVESSTSSTSGSANKDEGGKKSKSGDVRIPGSVLFFLNAAAVILRVYMDIRARPQFRSTYFLLMVLSATSCCIAHSNYRDLAAGYQLRQRQMRDAAREVSTPPDSPFALLLESFAMNPCDASASTGVLAQAMGNPLVHLVALQLWCYIGNRGIVATGAGKTLIERFVVYWCREVVPAFITMCVVYCVTSCVIAVTLHRFPSYTCG